MEGGGRILFGAADYVIFALVLLASASIGLYYAVFAGRQKTTSEFLMADRSMGFFPVGMSLMASLFTGIYIQGVTADVYFRGTMMWWNIMGQLGATWITARCFLPIYYNLRLTSIYEYLELRFNPIVRTCGLVVCYAYMLLHSGIATFGASMVLIAVTKINLTGAILTLSFVTMFYTSLGGIKAVLWADCLQMCLIFTSLVAVVIQGSVNVGGWYNVIDISNQGQRIEFSNFSLDPKEYITFWNSLCGIIAWLPSQAIMQYQVQRYLTCKDFKTANMAITTYVFGMVWVTSLCCMAGLAMYASYAGCDPFTQGNLRFRDGLMPYFILDSFRHLPGVAGLLTAGLCSLCLSTVSSVLNALSAVTGQHVVQVYWPDLTDSTMVIISKLLTLFFGAVVIGSSFLMTQLGDLIPALLGIIGITNGPILGVFILGIFTSRATSKGALVGFFTSFAIGVWLLIGSLKNPYPLKSLALSVEECPAPETDGNETMTTMFTMMVTDIATNVTSKPMSNVQRSPLLNFYALSKMWYPGLTTGITVLVGMIASLALGANDPESVDPSLVCYLPNACCFCLPNKWKFWARDHDLKEIPAMTELGIAVPLKDDYEDHNKPRNLKSSPLNNGGALSNETDNNSNHDIQ